MLFSECRVDKRMYDKVPIDRVMSMPSHLAPALFVQAPPFPVPRDEAVRIARARAGESQGAVAYVSKEILRSGDLILRLGEISADEGPRASGSWVAFIDRAPEQSFAHPCLYMLIDSDRSVREFPADWYPMRWRELFAPVD